MRISDWSSDVCSSDLHLTRPAAQRHLVDDGVLAGDLDRHRIDIGRNGAAAECAPGGKGEHPRAGAKVKDVAERRSACGQPVEHREAARRRRMLPRAERTSRFDQKRSEEHTSELQSLMRNSYAVFCLKKKKKAKSPC